MIAHGAVPVGCPVDARGAATADLSAMVGIAGRVRYEIHAYGDGDPFPLVTDKECLTQLAGPGDVTIGGIAYRLHPSENHYVTIRGGKIVGIAGKAHG